MPGAAPATPGTAAAGGAGLPMETLRALDVDGKVKVHSGDQVFAELGTKQCFGEMAILDAEPRSASITALTDLTLLKIQREDFSEILGEKPDISRGIIKVLTGRLREANRR